MIYTDKTKKAMLIAYQAHKEQTDKNGVPYIFHPIHLAEQMDTDEAVIIALLHDVIEDTDWTIDTIEQQGFSQDVIDALKILTHTDDIDYLDYVRQIRFSSNPYAIAVKRADLKHNSDLSRLEHLDDKALLRIKKYAKAIDILNDPVEKQT